MRPSGRAADTLREISLTPGFSRHAEGSCLIRMGNTEVLCAASVEARVPPFLRNSGQGWVTAEYGMLPRATHTRGEREAARGKQSGRTQEIQRLIGRSLRAVVDRSAMGEVTDHARLRRAERRWRHALRGDHRRLGRAVSLAFRHMLRMNVIKTLPLTGQVAAVSCGIVGGEPVLDLDYDEDSSADADANFVLTDAGGIVEIQGTAEKQRVQRGAVPRHAGPRAPGRRGAVRGAARGASARRDGAQARRAARRLVLASHNPGKLRRARRSAAPARRRGGLRRRARPAGTAGGRAGLRRQCAHQGAGGSDARAVCRRWPTIPASASPRWTARPACYSARWAGPAKDFAAAMARVHERDGRRRGPARLVRRRAVPRLAGRPHRDLRRPRRWHGDLAAARRQGLRLRSDVRAGRQREDLRRNGPGRKARGQPSRARVRPTADRMLRGIEGRAKNSERCCRLAARSTSFAHHPISGDERR